MVAVESWGRRPKVESQVIQRNWNSDPFAECKGSILPYGQGRSYGDSCLNGGGTVLSTAGLDRILSFDVGSGILRAEAGLRLKELLEFAVPRGWFIAVSPGTQYVSLGGAIANDIHGKNHHRRGTFGCHVRRLSVRRSNGEVIECGPQERPDFFSATVAGLGLTGFIEWVELQLIPIETGMITMESIQCSNLGEFFAISAESAARYEYTVAWVDCLAAGGNLGRGVFMRGNHATKSEAQGQERAYKPLPLVVPIECPDWLLNKFSVAAFNAVYYHKQQAPRVQSLVPYQPFFYPLDAVSGWNKIYGRRGFYQFQCVVPPDPEAKILRQIFERVVSSGRASFLAVLKEFGDVRSPGMLSFPRLGSTLCLDFAHSEQIIGLLKDLERLVIESGGALYPAKDALMSPESFKTAYPRWQEFTNFIDPKFSSSFWRRVMGGVV